MPSKTITQLPAAAAAASGAVVAADNAAGTLTEKVTLGQIATLASGSAPVQSVAGKTGTVVLAKADVGLSNVDNTSDASKPVSTAQAAADSAVASAAAADATTKANAAQAAAVQRANHTGTQAISTVSGLQAALDAKATPADVSAAVSALVNAAPSALDTLGELATALGSDPNFATTVTNALAAKAPTASPTFTGTVSGVTKAMVGLGNVDNTSDANKPVSTAQAAADSAVASAASADATSKANAAQAAAVQRANHTGTQTASTISDFSAAAASAAPVQSVAGRTGAVSLTKSDVGLSNVDNTSDASKPIGTATQTALNGKADSSHTHTASQVSGLAAVATSGAYSDLTGAPGLKAVRVDSSATTTVYVGKAAAGTANSSSGWTITRYTFSTIGVLQLTTTATGIWNNRTTLIYS